VAGKQQPSIEFPASETITFYDNIDRGGVDLIHKVSNGNREDATETQLNIASRCAVEEAPQKNYRQPAPPSSEVSSPNDARQR
jgi:hypothetical protein